MQGKKIAEPYNYGSFEKVESSEIMATQKEVAEKAGVSYITVSRFLNDSGYVKSETREKIQRAIEELHYHPDSIGQSLQKGRVKAIGLIVPPASALPSYGSDFYHLFLQGVNQASARHGYDILYSISDRQSPADYLQLYLQRKIAGIILFIPDFEIISLDAIVKHNIPCVMYGERPRSHPLSFVDADGKDAFYKMTKYLIGRDVRSFGFLKGPARMYCSEDRYGGFAAAIAEYRIPQNSVSVYESDLSVAGGFATAERLLAAGALPGAMICSNDLMALGVMKAAHRAGLRIPHDLSICGYDDISAIEICDPPLSTIRPPVFQMGGASVDLLLDLLGDPAASPKQLLFPAELVIRDSTI